MLTRRRFVWVTAASGAAAAVAVLLGQLGPYPLDERTRARLRALSPGEYVVVRAFARRVLMPDQAGAPDADALEVALGVDAWIAGAAPALRRDLRRLLGLVEHGTPLLLGRRRRFSDLRGNEQDAYLAGWAHSRLSVLREGFGALKALCMMAYYRDPRAWAVCGYEGPIVPRGWAGAE
jgi:hypothetical protein